MKRTVFLLIVLLALVGTAQAQRDTSLCDQHPEFYATFGPECLNPVYYDLAGYLPIGTLLDTPRPLEVMAYYWHPKQHRYLYLAGKPGSNLALYYVDPAFYPVS
jgi:hypothetical protein